MYIQGGLGGFLVKNAKKQHFLVAPINHRLQLNENFLKNAIFLHFES